MTTKRNDDCSIKASGPGRIHFDSPSDQEADVASFDSGMSRKEFIRTTALASVLLAIPWASTADAQVPRMPTIGFKKNKTRDGIIGPYGEVRIFNFEDQALPLLVSAAGGLAVM